jgi:hypothetical protein
MKKCSICHKLTDNLTLCLCPKEIWHGYGADPDYKITQMVSKAFCPECIDKPILGMVPFPIRRL